MLSPSKVIAAGNTKTNTVKRATPMKNKENLVQNYNKSNRRGISNALQSIDNNSSKAAAEIIKQVQKTEEKNEKTEKSDEEIITHENELAVRKQILSKNKQKQLTCTYCYRSFKSPRTFQQHFQVHTSERPHACNVCSKRFKNINNLKKHLECVHLGFRKYNCFKCGHKFSELSNLRLHELTLHDPLRIYECAICSCRFASKVYLEHHICREHLDPTHECMNCKELFVKPSTLKKHMRKCRALLNIRFICGECNKSFYSTKQLNLHQKSSVIVCKICCIQFNMICAYKRHVKMAHHNQQVFQCKFCEKTFTCKPGLLGHQWVYHGKTSSNYEVINFSALPSTSMK